MIKGSVANSKLHTRLGSLAEESARHEQMMYEMLIDSICTQFLKLWYKEINTESCTSSQTIKYIKELLVYCKTDE